MLSDSVPYWYVAYAALCVYTLQIRLPLSLSLPLVFFCKKINLRNRLLSRAFSHSGATRLTVNPRIEAGVSVYILGGPLPVTELHVHCVVIWT